MLLETDLDRVAKFDKPAVHIMIQVTQRSTQIARCLLERGLCGSNFNDGIYPNRTRPPFTQPPALEPERGLGFHTNPGLCGRDLMKPLIV